MADFSTSVHLWLGEPSVLEYASFVLVLLGSGAVILGPIRAWLADFLFGAFGAAKLVERIDTHLDEIRDHGRWWRFVPHKDREAQAKLAARGPKVVYVASNKGGVGKTTLALNLGACFALKYKLRVLFVDLDFQGNLTQPLRFKTRKILATRGEKGEPDRGVVAVLAHDMHEAPKEPVLRKLARGLKLVREFSPTEIAADLRRQAEANIVRLSERNERSFDGFENCGYLGVSPNSLLAEAEDYYFASWVAKMEEDDVRFRLTRFLASDEVVDQFDVVVLDSPPRTSLAAINGLCAASHILIPSRPEAMSWKGIEVFLGNLTRIQSRVFPNAKIAGFVRTFGQNTPAIDEAFDHWVAGLNDPQRTEHRAGDRASPRTTFERTWPMGSRWARIGTVPETNKLRENTAKAIPYIEDPAIRPHFEEIAKDVIEQFKVDGPFPDRSRSERRA